MCIVELYGIYNLIRYMSPQKMHVHMFMSLRKGIDVSVMELDIVRHCFKMSHQELYVVSGRGLDVIRSL